MYLKTIQESSSNHFISDSVSNPIPIQLIGGTIHFTLSVNSSIENERIFETTYVFSRSGVMNMDYKMIAGNVIIPNTLSSKITPNTLFIFFNIIPSPM